MKKLLERSNKIKVIPAWCVMDAARGRVACDKCGATDALRFPCTLDRMLEQCENFGARHLDCTASPTRLKLPKVG